MGKEKATGSVANVGKVGIIPELANHNHKQMDKNDNMLTKDIINNFKERYPWIKDIDGYVTIRFGFNPHDPFNPTYRRGIIIIFATQDSLKEFNDKYDGFWEMCPVHTKLLP